MNPICTQLSFSAGTGSGCLAEMVLRGDLERPKNFVVIRANPGMENGDTNKYCADVAARFQAAGIPYIEVKRDLLRGLLDLKTSGATRFDLPPFWTKNRETGKKGRLLQRCTNWAKIAPMDRALREWMHYNLGISKAMAELVVLQTKRVAEEARLRQNYEFLHTRPMVFHSSWQCPHCFRPGNFIPSTGQPGHCTLCANERRPL